MSTPIQHIWNLYTGKTIRFAVRDEKCGKQVDTYLASSPFRDLGADELEYYEIAKRGRSERYRYVESMVMDVRFSSKGLMMVTQAGFDVWVNLDTEIAVVEPLVLLTT